MRQERATANDRLKDGFGNLFWTAMIVAVVAHVLLFSLWPQMRTPDYDNRASELTAVDLPPEVDVPPPPEPIARPATPVISANADIPHRRTPMSVEPQPTAECVARFQNIRHDNAAIDARGDCGAERSMVDDPPAVQVAEKMFGLVD